MDIIELPYRLASLGCPTCRDGIAYRLLLFAWLALCLGDDAARVVGDVGATGPPQSLLCGVFDSPAVVPTFPLRRGTEDVYQLSMTKTKHIILLITACLLLFTACRPKGVLSSREMRDLLYDLHRADGAIQVAGYNYSHDEELARYYQSVLDKHGVTQAQFDSSLVWYTDNPQRFNKIYPKVVAQLEQDLQQQEDLRDNLQTLKPTNENNVAGDAGALARGKENDDVRRRRGSRRYNDYENYENYLTYLRNGLPNPWSAYSPWSPTTTDILIPFTTDTLPLPPDTLILPPDTIH